MRTLCERIRRPIAILFFALLLVPALARAQASQSAAAPPPLGPHPRVLIVVAHPDDESCFSATVYEITHNIGGSVDQLIITNGEGGYRYSLLAEGYYHEPLTNEAVGRAMLPDIRKREVLEAGSILGITTHFFLDERDVRYTLDIDEVLTQHWNAALVLDEVKHRLEVGNYDFVFTLFPSADTHGAHKAAAITALNAIAEMQGDKPVVLACQDASSRSATPLDWTGFQSAQHPYTVAPQRYSVDRNVKFGFNNVMDYQIIANWVIAAQKSQGAFQMGVNDIDKEQFAILDLAAPSDATKADQLFHALSDTAAHPVPLRPASSP
jgi:LmbE family N-acetylglucosaminyl deacetylase